jgi:hypothetical protein
MKNEPQYLTKQVILDNLKKDKINYFISQMGSGKTTASLELMKDYLKQNKRVLFFSPYLISNRIIKDEKSIQRYIKNKQLDIGYFSNFIEGYQTSCNKEAKGIEAIKLYRTRLIEHFNKFDLIILDETDFLDIQLKMRAREHAFTIPEKFQSFSPYASMIAGLSLLAKSKANVVSISANTFEGISEQDIKESMVISGIESIKTMINYVDTNFKSNINIKSIRIINYTGTNIERFETGIINGLDSGKNILYSSSKWCKSHIKTFVKNNICIIARQENLSKKLTINSISFESLVDYKNLFVIGTAKDGSDNLSEDKIKNNQTVAVNQSSARAVSLVEQYENSRVFIFSKSISANTLQVMARFRKSPTDIVLIVNNKSKADVLKELTFYDKGFMSSHKDVVKYDCVSNGTEYNELNITRSTSKGDKVGKAINKAKGLAKGKAISQKTIDKNKSIELYISSNTDSKKSYANYLRYCKENNLISVSRNTYKNKVKTIEANQENIVETNNKPIYEAIEEYLYSPEYLEETFSSTEEDYQNSYTLEDDCVCFYEADEIEYNT